MARSSKRRLKAQPNDMIFALDIGTRSILGLVGMVEGDRLRVVAMEKEEHTQRSMIDGQIEDIDQVAQVAGHVKKRLEDSIGCRLKRVCVAAAGRALRTQAASYEMDLSQPKRVTQEMISQLEAGAIGQAEETFIGELDADSRRQFYLVGHTVVRHYMDGYPTSSLVDHQARQIQADVIATFLPSEVVESLYATMARIGLEVASLTLEPIAAMNAVIPKHLRLLNLALVDIGAGTSDIAVCRDGGVSGYTMATLAGDEITEALMKQYLLDFNAAERVKLQLASQESVDITNILGFGQTITRKDMEDCIASSIDALCREISKFICCVNGNAPTSAVFLAGGGSKLTGVREGVAQHMGIDVNRVAIAGSNFETYAYSDVYHLNDPEYATPLGIAISAGLNLITESFQVFLNGNRAKLFRNNSITISDILMMNGFSFRDFLPRTGQKLIIHINGSRTVYYGEPGEPAQLQVNGRTAKLSDMARAGDRIEFTPATHGRPARRCLQDVLPEEVHTATVNGQVVPGDTMLKGGDQVVFSMEPPVPPETADPEPAPSEQQAAPEFTAAVETPSPLLESAILAAGKDRMEVLLNNRPMALAPKVDGEPYYLMDLLALSGLDLEHPTGELVLRVNGEDSTFLQALSPGDRVEIYFESRRTGLTG